jgi:hypothetical protein
MQCVELIFACRGDVHQAIAFETIVADWVRLEAEYTGIPLAKTAGGCLFGLRAARPEKAATRSSDLEEAGSLSDQTCPMGADSLGGGI